MNSNSQPSSNPPDVSNSSNATPPLPAAQTPSPSTSVPPSAVAAGAPPANPPRSYASATKKPFSPPIVSGSTGAAGSQPPAQHVKSSSASPVNGKPSIPPAVPNMGAPSPSTATNPNPNGNMMNGASTHPNHSRKPSVTINASGASGHMPNGGGPVAGSSSRPNSIQFGFTDNDGSPAVSHPAPHMHQPAPSLPVGGHDNPRVSSPQTSPSPIPQPAASGGRPPSALHGQAGSLNFGSLGGEQNEASRPARASLPPGQAPAGPAPIHLRRESSHSANSEISNPGYGPGAGRGGYAQSGGRSRGGGNYGQHFNHHQQHQMGFQQSPGGYRGPPNQNRGGPNMGLPQFPGQGGPIPYQGSPHRSARSPALTHSVPTTPQMHQSQMSGPPMHNQQMGGYPPHMAPQQVNPPFVPAHSSLFMPDQHWSPPHPEFLRVPHPLPTPNSSPQSRFMEEHIITQNMQAPYGQQIPYDQHYGAYPPQYQMYNNNMYMGGQSGSPRPPFQNLAPSQQQHYVSGQYAQPPPQPQSMSRTSSSVSEHRPNSSIGQPPTPSMTPASHHAHQPSQGKVSPTPNSNFKIPTRKSGGIVIKDPNSGAVIKSFEKAPSSPAPTSRSPAVSSTPTPPPRPDSQHSRTESKSLKSDAEKRKETIDAIAKKVEADRVSEKQKADDAEQKAADEKDVAERAKKDAEEKQQREKEAAAKADQELKDLEAKAERDEEERIRKREEEEVAKKAEEARHKAEEEENAKKAAEAEAAKQEEIEESAAAAKEEASKEEPSKPKDAPSTPSGLAAGVAKMSLGSGASTPGSDDSMGPPPKPVNSAKRDKPAALNLAPLKTGSVEPPQPSAALQALRSARFIDRLGDVTYPAAVASPNPALNETANKGRFKYDRDFLLQFKQVFTEKPSLDWDTKLKETVGDTSDSARPQSAARTPSMGPRNTSGRPGIASTFSSMGSFGQGGKTLPPGTTSEQRFALSNSQGPRPAGMSNPLAQFGRPGGAFPMGGTPLSRTNSSNALPAQGAPQSPRANNRSQRNNSKRGNMDRGGSKTDAQEMKEAKQMPLTAAGDIKPLALSTGGWKPRSLAGSSVATGASGPAPGAGAGNHMDPEMVQRKVKSNLNKMTPEKFEKIADQILEIAAQSKDETDGRTFRQVIQLTFEKATDEAHWASMYAKFCKRMLESMSPDIKDDGIRDKNGNVVTGGNLFRKYLLNRCQEEFERGWKSNLPDKPEGESEEAVMLSEEYYVAAAAKRRGLGLVQFIGELYKLGMLTERIMHECVKKLVDYDTVPDEAEVESLSKLLRTIGYNLDHTEKGKPLMDVYFQRINVMMESSELNSRFKFMLMDVIDLRRKGWAVSEANRGPQTIQEIREEAARQQVEKEAERARQQNQRHHGGGGGGRMPMGRGDARSFSGGGQYGMMQNPEPQRATVGMDELRRLSSKTGGSRQASQGQPSFGPTSMFSSRSNSGRKPLGPGGLAKGGEDSSASSRGGTPPVSKEKGSNASGNAFSALAGLESAEQADPTSPPSAQTSPQIAKAKLSASGASSGGQERPKSPLGQKTEKDSKPEDAPAEAPAS
ncbi:MAG: hypothetical protein M4579_002753 [Chaenotheca gracillima]|nr:MAG: hypothetical protein M4579_002753 [Chaenotheca gracillima]